MTTEVEETENSSKQFEFDDEFQQKIAAFALRDTKFLERTEGLIQPFYFESDVHQAIVNLSLGYYEKYRKAPDKGLLKNLVNEGFKNKVIRSKELTLEVWKEVDALLRTDISDDEFVTDEVVKFARHRAIEEAMVQSIKFLQRHEYDKIAEVMGKARDVGIAEDVGEYDYFGEIDSRTEERVALAAGTMKYEGITTGYPDLDKYLYHKGWGRKELSVIMGAAKAGKSMSLGEFAKSASLAGYNVLYVTLEVASKIIASRTDANLSDTAMRLLNDNPFDVKAKVKAAEAKAGKFKLREYATGSFKASQLRRLLNRYKAKGIVFDLVIVDYADIMAPERFTGDLREDTRTIYIDLRSIAFDYNVALLTATQTNREGAKSQVAKMTDVAEDFNKIRTADLVISINATDDEKKAGEARLYFAATRNSEGDLTLRIKQDRAKMQFIKSILGKA
jgi:replicative DNA helicase